VESERPVIVKQYGRGSLLGYLSLPLALLMAAAGMRGWQQSALRAMEDDAVEMAKEGYRVAATDEYGWPAFGITWYKVTYEKLAS
jgi:hypothetical protein